LEKPKFALLVVNMLKDMIEKGKPYKMPQIFKQLIVPKIKEFIEDCRRASVPVIYVCDAHRPGDPEFSDFPKGMEHAVSGTEGAEIIEEVKPREGDFVVTKRRFSGFFGTELECLLSELRVNSVIAVGRPTNVCVLYTLADAFFRGFKVYVITDCMYSANEINHLRGLVNMFFAEQLTADEFRDKFLRCWR